MNDWGTIWADSGQFTAVCLGLFVFGFVFNRFVDHLHSKGLNDGYVWLEVITGVGATLIASAFLVGPETVITLFILFACSGFWMAFGDIERHVKARKGERENLFADFVNTVEEEN